MSFKSELLETFIVPTKSIIKAAVKKKQQNKRYYDRVSKPLPPLVVGEHIRSKVIPNTSPVWSKGKIVGKQNERSYVVQVRGKQYRRDRFHIRKTRELLNPVVQDTSLVDEIPSQSSVSIPHSNIPPEPTVPLVMSPKRLNSEVNSVKEVQQPTRVPNETMKVITLPSQKPECRRSKRDRKPNSRFKDFKLYK